MNRLLNHSERATPAGRLFQYATALLCGDLVKVDDTKPDPDVDHYVGDTFTSHHLITAAIPALGLQDVNMHWQDYPSPDANWVSMTWDLAKPYVYQHQDPKVYLTVSGRHFMFSEQNLNGHADVYAHNRAERPRLGDTWEDSLEAIRAHPEAWQQCLQMEQDENTAQQGLREQSLYAAAELAFNILHSLATTHGLEPYWAFVARQEAIEDQE